MFQIFYIYSDLSVFSVGDDAPSSGTDVWGFSFSYRKILDNPALYNNNFDAWRDSVMTMEVTLDDDGADVDGDVGDDDADAVSNHHV